jgi:hypothetical protein
VIVQECLHTPNPKESITRQRSGGHFRNAGAGHSRGGFESLSNSSWASGRTRTSLAGSKSTRCRRGSEKDSCLPLCVRTRDFLYAILSTRRIRDFLHVIRDFLCVYMVLLSHKGWRSCASYVRAVQHPRGEDFKTFGPTLTAGDCQQHVAFVANDFS